MSNRFETCCGACFLHDATGWKDSCTTLRHFDVERVFWDLVEAGAIVAESTGSRRLVEPVSAETIEEARRRLLALDAARRLAA